MLVSNGIARLAERSAREAAALRGENDALMQARADVATLLRGLGVVSGMRARVGSATTGIELPHHRMQGTEYLPGCF